MWLASRFSSAWNSSPDRLLADFFQKANEQHPVLHISPLKVHRADCDASSCEMWSSLHGGDVDNELPTSVKLERV